MKKMLIAILIFAGALSAEVMQQSNGPQKTCGTPPMGQFTTRSYMDSLLRVDPAAYQKLLQQIEEVKSFNKSFGITAEKNFWAYNFKTKKYYTVTATLQRTGNLARIWVENGVWDSIISQKPDILDTLLANLEIRSGRNSIDPEKGIIEIDTTLFGQPPHYGGDSYVNFLILDIQDNYDSTAANSPFIAGYFSPSDQENSGVSNQMDLLYLDAKPGIYSNGYYSTQRVLSTTAHEFQHLIHYSYDTDEADWVNEGLSELAGTYCGYGLDEPGLYLDDTNKSLIRWSQEVRDYSRMNLWTLYCAEQLGLSFIKTLTQLPENSIAGFNKAMQLTGSPGSLNTVFQNWILTNRINSISPDPRFGYHWDEAQGLRAGISTLITEYPQYKKTGTVQDYAVQYIRFRGQDSLRLSFYNPAPQAFWLVSSNEDYRFEAPSLSDFSVPSFREDSVYVLSVYSTGNSLSYAFDAQAKYSLKYFEISYDDNQTDISISFQNAPVSIANRFTVPESNLSLESVSFWNGSPNNQVQVHVYGRSGANLPGNDLIAPVDTFLISGGGWAEVALPQPVSGLKKGDIIFAGITVNDPTKAVGYDMTKTSNISYVQSNSLWRPLSDYQINNENLDGVWMIRAAFSGLVLSDSIPPPDNTGEFIVEGNFPNPFSPSIRGTTILYQAPGTAEIQLEVYNTLGQKVADKRRNGTFQFDWNGYGYNGPLPSGIYFYRLSYRNAATGKTVHSKYHKMVIVR
ncbi:MAG: gliding motility-associated C-terminal domain-containing protein [Calditrichia bacterium]